MAVAAWPVATPGVTQIAPIRYVAASSRFMLPPVRGYVGALFFVPPAPHARGEVVQGRSVERDPLRVSIGE
jgi:hypothetical protein